MASLGSMQVVGDGGIWDCGALVVVEVLRSLQVLAGTCGAFVAQAKVKRVSIEVFLVNKNHVEGRRMLLLPE